MPSQLDLFKARVERYCSETAPITHRSAQSLAGLVITMFICIILIDVILSSLLCAMMYHDRIEQIEAEKRQATSAPKATLIILKVGDQPTEKPSESHTQSETID